jgi:Tol biopolymer transport system component
MRIDLTRSVAPKFWGSRWSLFASAAMLMILVAGGGWYLLHRPSAASVELQRVAVRTYEISPSFSPDGTRVVFAWDRDQEGKYDIYVRPATGGASIRLTTDGESKSNPAWSPDGTQIAFVKRNSGVFLIPSQGGVERKVSDSSLESSLAWTPDGKSLAVAERTSDQEPYRVVLVSLASGERRRLTAPPPGTLGDHDPAISPDGKNLCFVRWLVGSGASDLYVMPVVGGEPRRLTSDGVWIYSPIWTPDGREIMFSSNRSGGQNLWRIPAAGGKPKRLDFAQGEVRSAAFATLGPDKSVRMAYSTSVFDDNVWRLDLTHGGKPKPVIASMARDWSPQFSPDGNRMAFSSDRSGSFEIWVSRADGSLPAQLTSFGAGVVESPRWSPDGKHIAFAALVERSAANFTPKINRHVYVVEADGGIPRRLTSDGAEEARPSFSQDGRWIYFRSDHSGTQQIWKISTDGGAAPIQVTRTSGFEAFESPDGRLLYFTKGRTQAGLWSMPVDGGAESAVVDGVHSSFWGVANDGIFFVDYNPDAPRTAHKSVKFFSFETRKIKEVASIDKEISNASPAFSVTRDGRSILWTQIDQRGAQLILVENFR